MPGFVGQRVLVTGSTRGIGRALAREFVRAGAAVAVHGRSESSVAEGVRTIREELPHAAGTVVGVPADLAQPGEGRRLVGRTIAELGGLDLVVNNAGVHDPAPKPLWETPDSEVRHLMQVNLFAAFEIVASAVAHMQRQASPARIVNISSRAADPGNVGGRGIASYGISKFALEGLTLYLSAETAAITATGFRPSRVDTDMVTPIFSEQERRAMFRPSDVVPPILYLASAPHAEVHGRIFDQYDLMRQLGLDDTGGEGRA